MSKIHLCPTAFQCDSSRTARSPLILLHSCGTLSFIDSFLPGSYHSTLALYRSPSGYKKNGHVALNLQSQLVIKRSPLIFLRSVAIYKRSIDKVFQSVIILTKC